jgi:hypothetical protein
MYGGARGAGAQASGQGPDIKGAGSRESSNFQYHFCDVILYVISAAHVAETKPPRQISGRNLSVALHYQGGLGVFV